jgi:hypothetical protein
MICAAERRVRGLSLEVRMTVTAQGMLLLLRFYDCAARSSDSLRNDVSMLGE